MPDFTNTAPVGITITGATMTNTEPTAISVPSVVRNNVFGAGGSLPSAVWGTTGSDNTYTFTAPFPIVLSVVTAPSGNLVATIGAESNVPSASWADHAVIPKGTSVTLKIINTVSYNGLNVGLNVQGECAPESTAIP